MEWAALLGAAGVNFLQLREKDLGDRELDRLTRDMRRVLGDSGRQTKLLVNGSAEVAAAAGADGVHLPGGSGSAEIRRAAQVFAAWGLARPVISVSCHSVDDVRKAHAGGASMALFAPVFEKRVDGEVVVAGAGPDRLQQAAEAARGMPVLALGGVTRANTGLCLEAGAAGIAGIRIFLKPDKASARGWDGDVPGWAKPAQAGRSGEKSPVRK